MKNALFIFLCIISLYIGCKEEPTEPINESTIQENIAWPSLDSPWPIYQGDPQLTGRSRYPGPQLGQIEWKIEVPHTASHTEDFLSPIISSDSLIHVLTYRNEPELCPTLKTINFQGRIIRDINIGGWDKITAPPVIASDGTIYISKWYEDSLYAYTKAGALKWQKKLGSPICGVMNIGLDGTLFGLSDNGVLHAIAPDGTTRWSLKLPDTWGSPDSKISISSDGNMLYITAKNLFAVTAEGELKWTYSNKQSAEFVSPLVDNAGNIYIFEDERIGLISLRPDKSERFFYPTGYQIAKDITMDRNGNIYFGCGDSVYSIDYYGKLRWRKQLQIAERSSHFVCDNNSNIYIIANYSKQLYSFTENGTMRFSIPLEGPTNISPALSKEGRLYFLTSGPKRYMYSIQ